MKHTKSGQELVFLSNLNLYLRNLWRVFQQSYTNIRYQFRHTFQFVKPSTTSRLAPTSYKWSQMVT